MNRDDITRMAREAGLHIATDVNWMPIIGVEYAERFAALVAAAEREAILKDGWRQCAKDQRTTQFCGMLQQAVLTEREACAKVCDKYAGPFNAHRIGECADAIRARGQA